jgi:hypothetical protein
MKLVTAECIGLPGCPHHEEIADIKSQIISSHDTGMTLVASTMMTSKMLLSLHHHRQPWVCFDKLNKCGWKRYKYPQIMSNQDW